MVLQSKLLVVATALLSAAAAAAFRPPVLAPASSSAATRTHRSSPPRPADSSLSTTTRIGLAPSELHDLVHSPLSQQMMFPPEAPSSILISAEGGESWRQYVPLIVSVGVIVDILLGSPLANLALGPMRRASEKGSGGESDDASDNGGGFGGGSLFSTLGGNMDAATGNAGSGRGKERVDSQAIADAALFKAQGTLELRKFLDENKTNEQRYEDVRKKIDAQMMDLDDD